MRRARRSPPSLVVKMRVGVKPGQWGWAYEELVASAARCRGGGLRDRLLLRPRKRRTSGSCRLERALASDRHGRVTETIGLAVDVLNVSLRHPFLLAGQRAVAQAASGGRR